MEIEFSAYINRAAKRHELHAALSFAAAGSLCLLLFFLFLQKSYPSAGIFFALLLPANLACFHRYQQMRKQEKIPDQLRLERDAIVYIAAGKKCLLIPASAIARVEYREGLAIFFKQPLPSRLTVLDSSFFLSSFMAKAKRRKCDLFFEWFPKEVAEKLSNVIQLG